MGKGLDSQDIGIKSFKTWQAKSNKVIKIISKICPRKKIQRALLRPGLNSDLKRKKPWDSFLFSFLSYNNLETFTLQIRNWCYNYLKLNKGLCGVF